MTAHAGGGTLDRAASVPEEGVDAMAEEEEDDRTYKVVVNHEEQYSIWFADREPPNGWREVGKEGPKAACLEYINEVWTDMRPLSLRKHMEEAEARSSD
jgi:MbtH protein